MRHIASPILRVVLGAAAVLAVSASIAGAQVETLQYDHVHMSVPDPQVAAQWYHDHIGGEWVDGRTDRLLFGTTRIMFLGNRGNTRKPSAESAVAHLGDDLADLALLERVGLPVAVANAVSEVKDQAAWCGTVAGGSGAVREFAEALLRARGQWDELVEAYVERGRGR